MNYGPRDYGPSVMYDNGKIMVVGGGGPTATSETINLNAPVPTWSYTGTMANARRQANATLLPDGKVLVTGGSSGTGFDDNTHPVFPAELWNPATGTWSTMASLSVYRGYHSVALLLPMAGCSQAAGVYGNELQSPPAISPPTCSGTEADHYLCSRENVEARLSLWEPRREAVSLVTWIQLAL
jgi:hypothetical protein